jgi:HEAT repeat protein
MIWTIANLKAATPAAQRVALQSLTSVTPRSAALELLEQAIFNLHADLQLEAVRVADRFGPNGVPVLLKALGHSEQNVRREAAARLGKLGTVAAPAVPGLVTALRDPCIRVRMAVTVSLGSIGPAAAAAIEPLAHVLKGTNLILGRLAAQALSRIGIPAVPILVGGLRSPDPYVRREAAWALGEVGPVLRRGTKGSIPALPPALPGNQAHVRSVSNGEQLTVPMKVTAIVASGAKIKPALAVEEAVPELTRALRDLDSKVREAAGLALARIYEVAIAR